MDPDMIVFIDFEASSLSKASYPVEVGWVFDDGQDSSCLIRPASDWTDWSSEAEAIHGISRKELQQDGKPVATVAQMMFDTLSGHELFASAPSWDGKWLSTLLRAGGLPRHALRLRKSDDAFFEAARKILDESYSDEQVAKLVADVVMESEPSMPAHRALPDARLELERLRLVQAKSSQIAR
jgi:DNA polymerase III epsilon subunit-like protein